MTGLDLIDKVTEELWTEVHDIVQESGIKTIPMEKKCKKAKWLSGEALQIALKRREAKRKGEKGRYLHLNAEFQRIARRPKKTFLSDQCKEIEENNEMGKTTELFRKIRDTKDSPKALSEDQGVGPISGNLHPFPNIVGIILPVISILNYPVYNN